MVRGFFGAFVGEPNPPEHEEAKWVTWGQTVAAQIRGFGTPAERAHAVFDPDKTGFTNYPRIGPLMAAFTIDGNNARWEGYDRYARWGSLVALGLVVLYSVAGTDGLDLLPDGILQRLYLGWVEIMAIHLFRTSKHSYSGKRSL